jgi:hypothetical protein
MVNSNTLDNILDMLKTTNVLKSWSIYNDKYNGDIVVRVRFNGSQCDEAGMAVVGGTFKRKTDRQAARDMARATAYKQTHRDQHTSGTVCPRNICSSISPPFDKITEQTPVPHSDTIHAKIPAPQSQTIVNIGKSSLRNHQPPDIETNRECMDKLNTANDLVLSPEMVVAHAPPVSPSSLMSSPEPDIMDISQKLSEPMFSPGVLQYSAIPPHMSKAVDVSTESPSPLVSTTTSPPSNPDSSSSPDSLTPPSPTASPSPISEPELTPEQIEEFRRSLNGLLGKMCSIQEALADDSKD